MKRFPVELVCVAVCLFAAACVATLIQRRHANDAPAGGAPVAGMSILVTETLGANGQPAFDVVISVDGDRSVTVPVRFVSMVGHPSPTPEEARQAVKAWVRQRAIDTGRLSLLDGERRPTIYIQLPP